MAAQLILKLHGEEMCRIALEAGHEYIAGRAADAQIRLEGQRGISRHHLKFYRRDGTWVCEALSKFVLIQIGTETMEVVELDKPIVFTVVPYEFHFEPDSAHMVAESQIEDSPKSVDKEIPQFIQPRLNPPPSANGAGDTGTTSIKANNEATRAGMSHLAPYFRISYPNTADDEILKLEGQLWLAGRDSDCEIPIESPHISRKHFEIARTKDGFFITDLGSSNGTKVNGQRIPSHEPIAIESGDEIRVMNIVMTFEIRDSQFSNRLGALAAPSIDPLLASPLAGAGLLPAPYAMDPTQYQKANTGLEEKGWKANLKKLRKNKVRMALVILIPIVLLLSLLPSKPKENAAPRDPASSPSFETLAKEQKLVVKDSFNLARNLYVQGKYALCLTELAKLHELIPQYENSKELQSFCEQGLELVRRQEDLDRKERERAMIESQISGFVETCKGKLKATSTVEETRQCLAPAIELAPEHPLIIEMIHTAQMHEEEQKFIAQQKKEEEAKAAKGLARYNHAFSIYKKGRLAKSISEFEAFLNSTYPHSDTLKDQARRQIASIKKELKSKVDTYLDRCRSAKDKGHLKEAYNACTQAIQEDPNNIAVHELRDKTLADLRREMRGLYEDSVLEESLGNVDSAKEKWRKIIQDDVDSDDYYSKAKSKLKKYGVN